MAEMISFESLVRPDNHFRPCPLCGQDEVRIKCFDIGVESDPFCRNCHRHFILKRCGFLWLRRRYQVLTGEEFGKMLIKKPRKRGRRAGYS